MNARYGGWSLIASAMVVAAAATVFGASARPSPTPSAAPTVVPVTASVRVCPTTGDGSALAAGTTTTVAAATLPTADQPSAQPASSAPATDGVSLSPLSGSRVPFLSLKSAGTLGTYPAPGAKGFTKPTVLRAEGILAAGADASQVTYVPTGAHRALLGQMCSGPTGSGWFVGGSGATGRLTTVELDNPDGTPAVADIVVYGEHGQIEAPAGRGITVAPRASKTIRVDVLAPGTVTAALHVILRAGRAALTVTDEQVSGSVTKGADVIPATSAPARRVVIAGVPGGQKGSRTVQILAPGDQDALVRVQVLGRDGRFTPDNLAALDIPAGTVAVAQLLSQVGDGSVGVIVTSDVPVVAAVRNVLPSTGSTPDVTYSVSTSSLRGPVVASGLRMGSGWSTHLFLAAPSSDGSVTITLLRPDGTTTESTVHVTGGTSDELLLRGPDSFAAVVVPAPAPGGGPVFAAVGLMYQDSVGVLATEWPLVASPLRVTLPAVSTDPALGIPGH